ncbi:MAG: YicC family protein [Bacteroidales bacterium]|nr:YicC family protein [Bacteroidales bacterium]
MLLSMTGYGKAVCDMGSKSITIEIKSLNSKQFEVNTRIPPLYKEKDIEIRNTLNEKLVRGKVDFYLTIDILEAKETPQLNLPVIKNYYEQIVKASNELKIDLPISLMDSIMRLPDTLTIAKQELEEEEWKQITKSIHVALGELTSFRQQEGNALEKDIKERIEKIIKNLESITPFEDKRIDAIKNRIASNLNDIVGADKINGDRFEQEMIYYIEKMDITEEKVRLKNHCDFFLETMTENATNGKKLGFISQEIGREINTIGSKAGDSDIQRIVVEMKDELEKIKEQLMNVL